MRGGMEGGGRTERAANLLGPEASAERSETRGIKRDPKNTMGHGEGG